MDKVVSSYFDKDGFSQWLGVELISLDADCAVCELSVGERHLNGIGSVHGAVLFSLADIAFATVCNGKQASIGVQADIRYLKKPSGKRLTARAQLVSSSKKIAHYAVDVTDEGGALVVQFSGAAYLFPVA